MRTKVEDLWRDVIYAMRVLARNRGFATVAVLTLALGIGATSAIFTVINAVIVRPLPFEDPAQLVSIEGIPDFDTVLEWRAESRTLDRAAGVSGLFDFTLSGSSGGERVVFHRIGLDTLSLLGVEPILGRWFGPDEVIVGDTADSVVIGYGFWQSHFAGDPDVIGKTIPGWNAGWGETIIGVMPPDFWIFPQAVDVDAWYAIDFARSPGERPFMFGRIRDGVSIGQAQAELDTIARRRVEAGLTDFEPDATWEIRVQPLQETFSAGYAQTLLLLLGAVGFVLLIACLNVMNLQLSRSVGRQGEIATRVALGSGPSRLLRLLIAENLVLGLLGGLAGIAVAYLGTRIFVSIAPTFYPQSEGIRLDTTVLLFALALSLLSAFVFGLVPAIRASRVDLNRSLKQTPPGATQATRLGICRLMVVSEVALAVVLLVGAGLMINSYSRVMRVDMGFEPENILTMEITLGGLDRYRERHASNHFTATPAVANFYTDVLDRLSVLPGVEAVGMTSFLPPRTGGFRTFATVGGDPLDVDEPIQYHEISNEFFETMRIPLVRGRRFSDTDSETAPGVVIVNQTLALRFFVGRDPIGQVVHVNLNAANTELEDDRNREIVGVVQDSRLLPKNDPMPVMYVPYRQHLWDYAGGDPFFVHARKNFAIRTASNAANLAQSVRDAIGDIDPDVVVDNIVPMRDRLSEAAAAERFWVRLLGLFAGLGLFLAAVGLYGVVSYAASQRMHEFGIRAALGARKADVFKLVLREGLVLALIGLAIGIPGSIVLTRLISSQLFGVVPMDPLTISAVAFVLLVVALIACWIPGYRATKSDPLAALRTE